MADYESWTRLEPLGRDRVMDRSAEARISDPLWMLARQWQVGELRGEDCGSPVTVALRTRTSQITTLYPAWGRGARPLGTVEPRELPLEAAVEREPVLASAQPELAATLALELLRALPEQRAGRYREQLQEHYPLTGDAPDAAGKALSGTLAVRLFDGAAFCLALRKHASSIAIDPADATIFDEWRAWCDDLFSEPAGAGTWQPEHLEYDFSVSAPALDSTPHHPSQQVLAAREYHGGRLDWPAFDLGPVVAAPRGLPAPADQDAGLRLVTPVRFPGMAAPRWWELEDGRVSVGSIDTGPEDVARLLLVEFSLIYGNDFFLLPVELPAGSLCEVTTLKVTDSFGKVTDIPSANEYDRGGPWRMFGLSAGATPAGGRAPFFLAPALASSLEGPALEEVVLARDEMANLAWAIERSVEGATGSALDRFEVFQEQRRAALQPAATPSQGAAVHYHLESNPPPPHWLPLVPRESNGRILLDVTTLLRPDAATGGTANVNDELGLAFGPWGKLLAGLPSIAEEEVPREGVVVRRAWQMTRSGDGRIHAWVGRRRQPGSSEASSGLRFDGVEP
jgi:hypothetical protein